MPWKNITITRLEITNFKRFYGNHSIDLSPDASAGKPLILIGGDNGRGKTSIHEAINYALYEDDDLPGIHTRPNYIRAVSDRLNRKALDEGKTEYSVAVELAASDNGSARNIRIERQWEVQVASRTISQSHLRLFENGRPVDFIEDSPAAYQDFLRSLLPPRIAPFFFFDGERIQEFADDENHSRRMVEAIEDILHITVYKALRDDLKRFVVDYIEKHEIKAKPTDDYFQLQADKERIEQELEEKRDKLAEIERELDRLVREQKQVEDELRRIASPHASQRDELIAERTRLNRELEEAKADVLAGFEPLPILLSGELVGQLEESLAREMEHRSTPESIKRLQTQLAELKRRVLDDPVPPPPDDVRLSREQLRFYSETFDAAAIAVFHLTKSPVQPLLHDVGEAARQRIISRLNQAKSAAGQLRDAMNRRERLSNALRDVEIKLQSTSDDPQVTQLLGRNKDINERIGALQADTRMLNGDIQRLEADLATRSRQLEDRIEQRAMAGKARQAIKIAQDARRVLDEFIKRLAPEKLQLLRKYMNEMYGLLRKPEDPVRSIDVDPVTWQVVLRDERDRPLEKRVFSAGMKEMYALSLLWALSKASGRELPIVIDTPVGRLDTENRRALFEKYLPRAGHQVVVLCTDTEVDVRWAQRLAPYVSRQYRLDFDFETDSVSIRPGYFF